jgi:hypothetical protein
MKQETIVQFVFFETSLELKPFLDRWNQYERSTNENVEITLQQHVMKNGSFKYVSQYRSASAEFNFILDKKRSKSNAISVEVRRKLAGGYSAIQVERTGETKKDESKIMIFITDPLTDLESFREFCVHGKLNIYQAYYENCQYAYILELFVKNEYAAPVLQQLEILTSFTEAGIYKECHA